MDDERTKNLQVFEQREGFFALRVRENEVI